MKETRSPKDDREMRLKEALKKNMARRKAQTRARAQADDAPGKDEEE